MDEQYINRDADGSILHEREIDWSFARFDGPIIRKVNGWHFKDGKCDCSFDCCLGDTGEHYVCMCPDCPCKGTEKWLKSSL